jgi:hypothetical protein
LNVSLFDEGMNFFLIAMYKSKIHGGLVKLEREERKVE